MKPKEHVEQKELADSVPDVQQFDEEVCEDEVVTVQFTTEQATVLGHHLKQKMDT